MGKRMCKWMCKGVCKISHLDPLRMREKCFIDMIQAITIDLMGLTLIKGGGGEVKFTVRGDEGG